MNCIGGVIVGMFASNVVDRGFEPRPNQKPKTIKFTDFIEFSTQNYTPCSIFVDTNS